MNNTITSKASSFRKGFYHIRMAEELFNDVIREKPKSIAASMCRKYQTKLTWIKNDVTTNQQMPISAIAEFNDEMKGDILFHEAISEKSLNLTPLQKVALEKLIDSLIAGEQITVVVR